MLVRGLGAGPVRDVGLLDSAAARPRSTSFGQDAYPTMQLKAAALLHSIARNQALVDGNKRLAWLAATVFLDLNGRRPGSTDDEAFTLVVDVAEGAVGSRRSPTGCESLPRSAGSTSVAPAVGPADIVGLGVFPQPVLDLASRAALFVR
jgi:death-on-curing protein